jgi:hypothetical protein
VHLYFLGRFARFLEGFLGFATDPFEGSVDGGAGERDEDSAEGEGEGGLRVLRGESGLGE